MRIGISGPHGAGKTTLTYSVAAVLKSQSINTGIVTESARGSHYLISGDKSEAMHLEVMALHLAAEMRARRTAEVVLTDRTVFDFVTYFRLRFPGSEHVLGKAMEALCKEYAGSYNMVFVLPKSYGNADGDPVRATELTSADQFTSTLSALLREVSIPHSVIDPNTGTAEVARFILELRAKHQGCHL